jgi:hypothetical protein
LALAVELATTPLVLAVEPGFVQLYLAVELAATPLYLAVELAAMLTRAAKATNDDHEPTNGQKVVWGDENPWTEVRSFFDKIRRGPALRNCVASRVV